MIKSLRSRFGPTVAALILIIVVFGAGIFYGYRNAPSIDLVYGVKNKEAGLPGDVDFTLFWDAWRIINDKYAPGNNGTTSEKIATNEDKVYGAINGLAKSLGDPYSVFMNPEQTKTFASDINGNFEGVGMEIGIRDGVLTVIAPLKGTPAERAGIISGDRVLSIDGASASELSVDEAVRKIRGPKGTVVTLLVAPAKEGEAHDVKITRDVITIPTLEAEMKSSKSKKLIGKSGTTTQEESPIDVYLIKLYNFGSQSPYQFRDALRKFIDSGKDKLVIDLRGNPGGYLEAAVDIASWFLPINTPVVTEKFSNGKEDVVHKSLGYNVFNGNLKLAILVDGGSASASEILAGALSENGKAKLVGEKTFGKGSVQELVPLGGDSSFKITVARWYTPKGHSISLKGIIPDYVVERTRADFEKELDPQFDKAVEVLSSIK